MRILKDLEAKYAEEYCGRAADFARESNCRKAWHGATLVNEGIIIGEGCNTPVPNKPCSPCRREKVKGHTLLELCNSIHAENNAFLDALRHGHSIKGARMYHARINRDGSIRVVEGPKCTSCSRLVLHLELEGFVLFQEQGYVFYDAEEFNRLSFEYHENKA
jgi:deoxycytidylate deaminase